MSLSTASGPAAGAPPAAPAIPARPMRFLFSYIKARGWQFGALACVIVAAGSCAVAVQYGMKLIVDAMATENRAAANVWFPLGLFIGLIALESVLWRLGGWLGCRAVVNTGVDIRADLFEHLTGHPMRYFNEHLSGSLGNRITATAGSAGAIFSTFTWNIVPPCVDFIGAVVVLLIIDWHMAVALIAFVALVAGMIVAFGIRGRPLHRAYGEQAARVGGELVDAVSNVWAIKAFTARHRERARMTRQLGIEANAQRRSWMYLEKARVLHDVCLWVLAGSMLTWAIHSWQRGNLTAGDVVVISALTFRILHGSRDLALALVGTTQEFGVIAEMLGIIARPHGVRDPACPRDIRVARGAVRFSGVCYAHPGAPPLFRDFDLDIPAGQKLGVVGPSGGGKSTLLSLLQRLDDVQGGQILVDGKPITEMTQDALRAGIAVVPQEVSLFRRSIRENIGYGNPDATQKQIEAAARAARCESFIAQLPEGYDTVVGERGATLSGGQRQRLGLARAFLKNAPILILDEATSALDTRSEREVQQALLALIAGRTVIAVAHRLSTLARFDRVIVLNGGRIVEDGPPAALRRAGGLFQALWDMQAHAGDAD
ncbi:ABC transporter ATP-binding protein [Pigmentiphaga soli]|uniref:ABC transporter ATP-binding protein n=1 Tax=Pigmentiphaga soli TaxID=1007095 RepID=A0ABP8GXR2_9BURK